MAKSKAASPADQPRLGWRLAAALGAIWAVLIFAEDVDWLANLAGVTRHGDYGVFAVPTPDVRPGSGRIIGVRPGSPAETAGLKPGDHATMLDPLEGQRVPSVGDTLRLRVDRDGRTRDVTLTATPSRAPALDGDPLSNALSDLADIPAVLLGLFVLIRSRARPSTVLLGLALTTFGLGFGQVGPVFSRGPAFYGVFLANLVAPIVQYAAFLAFALSQLDSILGSRRWRWLMFGAACVLSLLVQGSVSLMRWGVENELGKAVFVLRGAGLVSMGAMAATLAILILAWRRSPPGEKGRFALLALAFGCIVFNQAWLVALGLRYMVESYKHFGEWHVLLADALAGVVAPALFAYAILKHRVLDLGFALNRTLVYSVVSAILLGAFGLIEWGVDHFTRIEGREQNALIDAAIALAVFLTFHRVRDFVEKAIEALFFRSWQEKEAELRRFVADAAFVTRRESLLAGFHQALTRFADGAECAVYMLAGQGGFVRAAGAVAGVGRALDADDPTLVRLRAERKPTEPAAVGSSLPAELACPMVHRGEVIGLVLMAGRTEGVAYRPDEAELLGWAALQVGLDLHALEAEQLQAQVSRLEHQLEGARLAARPA